MKVTAADGVRYTEYVNGRNGGMIIDIDTDAAPSFFGSFVSSSPVFHGGREYGRNAPGAQGRTDHLKLSMRHRGLKANAGFFDGHAETLTSQRIWSDPSLWYPRGSTYVGGSETPEISQTWEAGQTVN
jgi:prepilin-type processing-associated H-X9-DG protein